MTLENINPIKDHVVLELIENKEEVVGGILLPTHNSVNLTKFATVLKVGPGRIHRKTGALLPMTLKEGDVVIIPNLNRCEFVKNDENRLIFMLPEPFIEGIVDND